MVGFTIIMLQDNDRRVPALEWLDRQPAIIQDKARMRVKMLQEKGNELCRPHADYLRDKIYELRMRQGRTQPRLLYFFYGRKAVITHGTFKKPKTFDREIDKAVGFRKKYLRNPELHTYKPETGE